MLSLIRLVGADRVLFGTDYPSPMRDLVRPTELINNLELSQTNRDAILAPATRPARSGFSAPCPAAYKSRKIGETRLDFVQVVGWYPSVGGAGLIGAA